MPPIVAIIIGFVLGIAGAILAFLFIVPEKKKAEFKDKKFLLWLHDLFNFNSLLIEEILRFMYILTTVAVVGTGFFFLFSGTKGWGGDFNSWALQGLAFMILGPIAVRLVFEGAMMFVILVKKTTEINNKIDYKDGITGDKTTMFNQAGYNAPPPAPVTQVPVAPPPPPVQAAPAASPPPPAAPAPEMIFCTQCGTRYDKNLGGCPQGCIGS